MKKTIITAVAALAGLSFTLATPLAASAHGAKSGTYLYDCSTLTQRPTSITLTCADGNRYINHITWATWSGTSVAASGTLNWNTCTPSCAAGTMKTRKVEFIATDRKKVNGTWLYTELKGPKFAWDNGTKVFALPTSAL